MADSTYYMLIFCKMLFSEWPNQKFMWGVRGIGTLHFFSIFWLLLKTSVFQLGSCLVFDQLLSLGFACLFAKELGLYRWSFKLRYKWQNLTHLKYTIRWFDICTYWERISCPIKLINISITSHIYFLFFFFWWEHLRS